MLEDVGISDDVVVVVSVVDVVVPVASVEVVLSVVDSVVDSLSCAQAASVSDAATMAAAVRLRSVVFMGVLVCVLVRRGSAGPERPAECADVAKRAYLRAPTRAGSIS